MVDLNFLFKKSSCVDPNWGGMTDFISKWYLEKITSNIAKLCRN